MNIKTFLLITFGMITSCSATGEEPLLFQSIGALRKPSGKLQTALPKDVAFGFRPFPQSLWMPEYGLVKLPADHTPRKFYGTVIVPKNFRRATMRKVTRPAYEKDGKYTGQVAYALQGHRNTNGLNVKMQLQTDAEKAYKNYFPLLDKYGSLLFILGLIAEYFLYRTNKNKPQNILKAQEHLLQKVMALPKSHALRKLEWYVDDATLQRQVAYLVNAYTELLPDEVAKALHDYHSAASGPSMLRRVFTHGATLAGFLTMAYGGINKGRLASYLKDMGGRRLGR